jgi:hypothetical protein
MAILFCAFMQIATTTSRQMARNSDTQDNFLLWYIQEFGFNLNVTTALYDVQILKDAKTLSELDDDTIANICKAVSKDTGQSVAEIAHDQIEACVLLDQTPAPDLERDQGDRKTTCEEPLQWDH